MHTLSSLFLSLPFFFPPFTLPPLPSFFIPFLPVSPPALSPSPSPSLPPSPDHTRTHHPPMGTCLSNEKLPENVFSVRNIHDDNSRFPKGIIEVTAVELIYTDAKSRDRWVWPLKYLRKYGCDGDIFSFEAGRKCPGGEGLYAFSTKKAAQLFEMVARNINVGGFLPESEGGALSPQSNSHANSHSPISPVPPTLPPPVPASNPPPLPPIGPHYQNLQYQNGQHIPAAENGIAVESPPLPPPQNRRHSTTPSPSPAPAAPPSKVNYQQVTFPDPPDAHPPPSTEDKEERRVSYTPIDIKKTEEYNRMLKQQNSVASHPLPELGGHTFIDPTTLTSKKGGRSRLPTYHGPSSHRSFSDSSVGSPNSLTGSMKDMHLHANGDVPGPGRGHTSTSAIEASLLYQNLTLSANGPQLQQPNYMNLFVPASQTPQPSLSRKTSEQPSMYENLMLSRNTSPPLSSSSIVPNPSASPPRVSGNPMATYADLDLPRQTSTPKAKQGDESGKERSYTTLDFPTSNGTAINNTPAPHSGRDSPKHVEVSTVSSDHRPLEDDKVPYGILDFRTMEALRKTAEERQQDLQEREEEKKREEEKRQQEEEQRRAKIQRKKDKKKKDRRNSHN